MDMLRELAGEREPFGLITVVATHGSSPSRPGAMMAVRRDGSVVGSIAGGCVEGAVHQLALDVLQDGRVRVANYGPDGDLFRPGLTCGGYLTVLVEAMDPVFVQQALSFRDHHGAVAWRVDLDVHSGARGRLQTPGELDGHFGSASPPCGLSADGGQYLHVSRSPQRMLIVGSTAYAQALCRVATAMGYDVTVCDARPVFTTPDRFPDAVEVIASWPARWLPERFRSNGEVGFEAVVVATHDPKVDIPTLTWLCNLPQEHRPRYLGALGSSRSAKERRSALLAARVDPQAVSLLRSPIGLDLGDATPEQTAIAILAEIIHLGAARSQGPVAATALGADQGRRECPDPVGRGSRVAAGRSPIPDVRSTILVHHDHR